MENATKALLIAGGILIAMMTLALLVYVFGYMTDFAESQDRVAATQEIVEFNESYEAYNKQRMYGTDVISVVNKAEDNNIKYNDNQQYKVNVTVLDKNGSTININDNEGLKTAIFTCEVMEDSNKDGRIDSIRFKQI